MITKEIKVDIPATLAFHKFVNELNEWWPKEYTWSQDKLKEIKIDGKINGLCTEIGPYDFRCDWGRVTAWSENNHIVLKWQISPTRTPIPNPEEASVLSIRFIKEEKNCCIQLNHTNFENHGEEGKDYEKAMDSEQGWDYILRCFKAYCNA